MKSILKWISKKVILPFAYNIHRWKNVDSKLVLLADAHHEECPSAMKRFYDELQNTDYKIESCFFDVSKLSAFDGLKKMIRFMKLYAGCRYVVICDNFLPVAACRKKKATKVIQLWHACGAFKKFGYDTPWDAEGSLGNIYRNYDLVTVSSKEAIEHFTSAMKLKKNVAKDMGVSYTDQLLEETFAEESKRKFEEAYPEATGKKVILWTPTFRGRAGEPLFVGEEYMDRLMKDDEFARDYYLVKSIHPHGNKDVSITSQELMVSADVLITDYSSIFYEFLHMERPIVFFAPDYEEYKEQRGFYLDYTDLPGLVIMGKQRAQDNRVDEYLLEDLKQAILAIDTEDMKECRRRFAKKEIPTFDGEATKRIIAWME